VPRASARALGAAAVLGTAILALIGVSSLIGGVWLSPEVVFAIVFHQATGGTLGSACGPYPAGSAACRIATEIVWDARIPAIVVALAAGAALALSGGTLQGLFRNPLADPFLLGLSSGAATGTAILFAFGLFLSEQAVALPLFAFAGALVPGMVVYAASRSALRSSETLVLTGVALSSVFSAVLATFLFYNPSGGLQVSFWLLGSLANESWTRAGILVGAVLAIGAALAVQGRELNVLQLGTDVAHSVGVETARVVRRMILLTTLLTAAAVAFTGVIGFVGLVSPHAVRRLIGPDYRRVLPAAALFGGIFLLGAWDLAQVVIPTVVVPVGIPTAFVGGPSFLYLLYRRRRTPP
jgi:iron complex transport system permease protein